MTSKTSEYSAFPASQPSWIFLFGALFLALLHCRHTFAFFDESLLLAEPPIPESYFFFESAADPRTDSFDIPTDQGAPLYDWLLSAAAWFHSGARYLSSILNGIEQEQPAAEQCRQTLLPWQPLDLAMAHLPLHCTMFVAPGQVMAQSSVPLREGQSVRVLPTPGTFSSTHYSHALRQDGDYWSLLVVQPAISVNLPGEGTAELLLKDTEAPAFTIDGRNTYIDPHLLLPLPDSGESSCNGETGVIFSSPVQAYSFTGMPGFSHSPDCIPSAESTGRISEKLPNQPLAAPGMIYYPEYGQQQGQGADLGATGGEKGAAESPSSQQTQPGSGEGKGGAQAGGGGGGKRPPSAWDRLLQPYAGTEFDDFEAWLMVFWHYFTDILKLPVSKRPGAFRHLVVTLYRHAFSAERRGSGNWGYSFARALNKFTGHTFIPVNPPPAFSPEQLDRWIASVSPSISTILAAPSLCLQSLQLFLAKLFHKRSTKQLQFMLSALSEQPHSSGLTPAELYQQERERIRQRQPSHRRANSIQYRQRKHRPQGQNPSRRQSGYTSEDFYSDMDTSAAESDGEVSLLSFNPGSTHGSQSNLHSPARRPELSRQHLSSSYGATVPRPYQHHIPGPPLVLSPPSVSSPQQAPRQNRRIARTTATVLLDQLPTVTEQSGAMVHLQPHHTHSLPRTGQHHPVPGEPSAPLGTQYSFDHSLPQATTPMSVDLSENLPTLALAEPGASPPLASSTSVGTLTSTHSGAGSLSSATEAADPETKKILVNLLKSLIHEATPKYTQFYPHFNFLVNALAECLGGNWRALRALATRLNVKLPSRFQHVTGRSPLFPVDLSTSYGGDMVTAIQELLLNYLKVKHKRNSTGSRRLLAEAIGGVLGEDGTKELIDKLKRSRK